MSEPGSDRTAWYTGSDGERCLNEELACARLLDDGVLMVHQHFLDGTIALSVGCNDTFYLASADCEHVTSNDGDPGDGLYRLYEMWESDHRWGAVKWVALRRKLRPLPRWVEKMKEAGVWSEELEALPEWKPIYSA